MASDGGEIRIRVSAVLNDRVEAGRLTALLNSKLNALSASDREFLRASHIKPYPFNAFLACYLEITREAGDKIFVVEISYGRPEDSNRFRGIYGAACGSEADEFGPLNKLATRIARDVKAHNNKRAGRKA